MDWDIAGLSPGVLKTKSLKIIKGSFVTSTGDLFAVQYLKADCLDFCGIWSNSATNVCKKDQQDGVFAAQTIDSIRLSVAGHYADRNAHEIQVLQN